MAGLPQTSRDFRENKISPMSYLDIREKTCQRHGYYLGTPFPQKYFLEHFLPCLVMYNTDPALQSVPWWPFNPPSLLGVVREHDGSENCLEQKLRTPRRRCQQPKMLNSPEDNMYYNQLNGTLEYQGSKRKPRKLGQIKVLDREDEYYKSLSAVESIPEDDSFHSSPSSPSSRGVSFAQS
nr:PREDICTED: myosin-IIIb-like [Phalacrocorax carbo]